MKYYLFPLTEEESRLRGKKGYAYAIKNRSRWVELSNDHREQINTYDRSTTYLVKDDIPYFLHRDYTNIDESYRLYIGVCQNLSEDVIPEED